MQALLRTSVLTLFLLPSALPAQARPLPLNSEIISDVAEKVTPAVVNITTRRTRAPASGQFEGHPMLREFFGQRRRNPRDMGAGSGVVIASDGYIVTNNHVIEGADEIRVTFSDNRNFKAKLVGTDKPSDIALLKVKAKGLPHLDFGDSAKLRLGEIVLAVGNPFGVGQTVTMGIVSAKGRAGIGIIDYEDFIQTDASINPGNSGGALVNLRGQLVGINTAILSRSGGAQGIGFAVPSNMVGPIRQQIAKGGRVKRGWLGVAIQDLTPELARSMDLSTSKGVLISDIIEGGPAAKSDLREGDVVTAINGRRVSSTFELRNKVALTRPGSVAKLKVVRSGKEKSVNVTLTEKKERGAIQTQSKEAQELLSGLGVQELNRDVRRRFRIPTRVGGVVITQVAAGSPAEAANLEEGDIITSVNRKPVKSVRDFEKYFPKKAGEVLLRVFKRNYFTFVVLKK